MLFLQALHGAQAALSVYGLYVSYISITNLQKYEQKAEKAAEWSETAGDQLHKTRTTQASGTVAIFSSLLTSIALATAAPRLPALVRYAASPALLLGTLAARTHVNSFWHAKAKVPFVDGYNEAISMTTKMMECLEWLEWSWVGTALAGGVLGY